MLPSMKAKNLQEGLEEPEMSTKYGLETFYNLLVASQTRPKVMTAAKVDPVVFMQGQIYLHIRQTEFARNR